MVKMKGSVITFTGKDAKMVRDGAKKSKMTPRQWVIRAIENHAQNILFFNALDKQDQLKSPVAGVQLKTERVKFRREGTD